MLHSNSARRSPSPVLFYGVASGLRGFVAPNGDPIGSLRVAVFKARDGQVWCRTADLRDSGTPLVLTAAQVAREVRP